MKQLIKQSQKQSFVLTPLLQKQIKLLSLSGIQIRKDLYSLLNKFTEDEDKNEEFKYFKDECLIDKYRSFFSSDETNNPLRFEREETRDLREELQDQFRLISLTNKEISAGTYLIDSIDNQGRLDPEIDYEDLKEFVKENTNKPILYSEIEKVLFLIQNLEPAGCGYRNITESLIIQINNSDCDEDLKIKAIETLKEIALEKKKIKDIDNQVYSLIRGLRIYPGVEVVSQQDIYTKPDLICLNKKGKWFVSLNDSYMPKQLLEKINTTLEESSSNDNKTFKSFVTGLNRRQKTLLLVGEVIVNQQGEYLNNLAPLKSLSLSDISERTKLSISTISRIIKSKYLQLPNSLLLLESLVIKRVNQKGRGKDISSNKLIELITDIIRKENKKLPHSDEKLKRILFEEFSIEIARRTITKYRREAKIESSRARKVKEGYLASYVLKKNKW